MGSICSILFMFAIFTQSDFWSSFKASSKQQMQLFKYVCLFSYLRKIAKCFAFCISSLTFFLSIVLNWILSLVTAGRGWLVTSHR